MNKYYAPPGGIPGEFATVHDTRRYGRYTGGASVPTASSGTVKGGSGSWNGNGNVSGSRSDGDGGSGTKTHAGCGSDATSRYGLKGYPVGSTYAPLQDFNGLYDRTQALSRGTLFSALDLPWLGYGTSGMKTPNGGYRRG